MTEPTTSAGYDAERNPQVDAWLASLRTEPDLSAQLDTEDGIWAAARLPHDSATCLACRARRGEICCDRAGVVCAGCGSEDPECPVHHVCPGGGWL